MRHGPMSRRDRRDAPGPTRPRPCVGFQRRIEASPFTTDSPRIWRHHLSRNRASIVLVLVASALGCSSGSDTSPDAGAPDAGVPTHVSPDAGGTPDAGRRAECVKPAQKAPEGTVIEAEDLCADAPYDMLGGQPLQLGQTAWGTIGLPQPIENAAPGTHATVPDRDSYVLPVSAGDIVRVRLAPRDASSYVPLAQLHFIETARPDAAALGIAVTPEASPSTRELFIPADGTLVFDVWDRRNFPDQHGAQPATDVGGASVTYALTVEKVVDAARIPTTPPVQALMGDIGAAHEVKLYRFTTTAAGTAVTATVHTTTLEPTSNLVPYLYVAKDVAALTPVGNFRFNPLVHDTTVSRALGAPGDYVVIVDTVEAGDTRFSLDLSLNIPE